MSLMVSIMTSKYPQSVLEIDHMVKTWLSFQSPSCQLLIKKKVKESTESHRILCCIFYYMYYPSSGREGTLPSKRYVSNIFKENLECLSIYKLALYAINFSFFCMDVTLF